MRLAGNKCICSRPDLLELPGRRNTRNIFHWGREIDLLVF